MSKILFQYEPKGMAGGQKVVITEDQVQIEQGWGRWKGAVRYEQIAQVSIHPGLFSRTLEVVNTGGAANLRLESLSKADAEMLKDKIESQLREFKKKASQPSQHGALSVADELNKLADLKARGILTEQEFQSQKRKMLSS